MNILGIITKKDFPLFCWPKRVEEKRAFKGPAQLGLVRASCTAPPSDRLRRYGMDGRKRRTNNPSLYHLYYTPRPFARKKKNRLNAVKNFAGHTYTPFETLAKFRQEADFSRANVWRFLRQTLLRRACAF